MIAMTSADQCYVLWSIWILAYFAYVAIRWWWESRHGEYQ